MVAVNVGRVPPMFDEQELLERIADLNFRVGIAVGKSEAFGKELERFNELIDIQKERADQQS